MVDEKEGGLVAKKEGELVVDEREGASFSQKVG